MIINNLKRLAAILASGYILVYFSEHLFWAHIRPGDNWGEWVMVWLAYSLTGYLFLSTVALFRVRSFWGIFLAGALFGWLTEGVIVQTVYEDLPLSISFTGLGWHALLSVCVGWYALRGAIQRSVWHAARLSSLIGLIYGVWAISWWIEPEEMVTAPWAFFQFSLVATIFVVLAYWVLDATLPAHWKPTKGSVISAAGLILLYFLIVAVPAVPISALILPILIASVLFPLVRNRNTSAPGSLLETACHPLPILRYLPLLLIPVLATGFYSLAYFLEWRVPTNWMLYAIVTPAGFILWVVAMIKLWRKNPAEKKITISS